MRMQAKFSDQEFWRRIVLVFIGICLIWYWYSGMMLHHVADSPFNYKGADPAYWLIYFLRIDRLILFNTNSALIFSGLLIISFIAATVFVRNRAIAILAGVLLLLYQIVFNMKLGYHTHHLYGLQFAMLPFYFRKERFVTMCGFARFMVCLTYFFAGFFKLVGKGWSELSSFSNTLQNQHAAYFYFEPDSLRTLGAAGLSSNVIIAFMFFCIAMLMQLSFISGFFTRKFDKWLALFLIAFHVMDWYLMNLGVFMGMCIMAYLFFACPEADTDKQ